jgi:hypothetical protein
MSADPPTLDELAENLKKRIDNLRQHLPPEQPKELPKVTLPFLAHCPLCGMAMEAGKVVVHGTLLGFLIIGFSYQHCWFQPADGSSEQIVVPNGGKPEACCCKGCGFVGIRHTEVTSDEV